MICNITFLGWCFNFNGVSIDKNPFLENTPEHAEFNLGWVAAYSYRKHNL
jgi:hypothetical protein